MRQIRTFMPIGAMVSGWVQIPSTYEVPAIRHVIRDATVNDRPPWKGAPEGDLIAGLRQVVLTVRPTADVELLR